MNRCTQITRPTGAITRITSSRANISFQQYESGHMRYLCRPDAEKLRTDLLEFVTPR